MRMALFEAMRIDIGCPGVLVRRDLPFYSYNMRQDFWQHGQNRQSQQKHLSLYTHDCQKLDVG
jgi:hypothetical protein